MSGSTRCPIPCDSTPFLLSLHKKDTRPVYFCSNEGHWNPVREHFATAMIPLASIMCCMHFVQKQREPPRILHATDTERQRRQGIRPQTQMWRPILRPAKNFHLQGKPRARRLFQAKGKNNRQVRTDFTEIGYLAKGSDLQTFFSVASAKSFWKWFFLFFQAVALSPFEV